MLPKAIQQQQGTSQLNLRQASCCKHLPPLLNIIESLSVQFSFQPLPLLHGQLQDSQSLGRRAAVDGCGAQHSL